MSTHQIKPALCPVCGNTFSVPTTGMLGTKTLGKQCPHCRTIFNPQTIKALHDAAAMNGKLPALGKQVLVYGGNENAWIPLGWHQAALRLSAPLVLDNGRDACWITLNGAVILNVTRWTELPVYSIEIESKE